MSDSNTSNELLDSEELMHLALKATETGEGDKVLSYLKQILATEAEHAMALYLLGAQHAQMGLFDRAKEEISRAVELEPNIPVTAHLQLGLLYLASGDVASTMDAWEPLDQLADDDALHLFKRGLTYLVQDEFAKCIEYLEKGIAANKEYPALNPDMQVFMDKAREALDQASRRPASASKTATAEKRLRQADLSAYDSNPDD